MPVLGVRNPFSKKPVNPIRTDAKLPPTSLEQPASATASASAISILSVKSKDEEPDTYKLCVVNDSGVYLPPSPPEKKSFWRRSENTTTAIPNHREALKSADNDGGFAISRESFDSYRRSFDISARSPISPDSSRPSLDARNSTSVSRNSLEGSLYTPSTTHSFSSFNPFDRRDSTSANTPSLPAHTEDPYEPEFKDVDLHEVQQPKKKSFLSRFGAGNGDKSGEEPEVIKNGEGKGHTRTRSGTVVWRKEVNKEAEELGDINKQTELK